LYLLIEGFFFFLQPQQAIAHKSSIFYFLLSKKKIMKLITITFLGVASLTARCSAIPFDPRRMAVFGAAGRRGG
jgi:hypothetical protein